MNRDMSIAYFNWCGGLRSNGIANSLQRLQWIEWWSETGVFDKRGRLKDDYCMARLDREKPFSLDNIELSTNGVSRRRPQPRRKTS